MFDFFGKILGYADMMWSFFINSINMCISALGFLLSALGMPNVIAPFMPTIIGTAITCFVAIYLVKFVLSILPF